ncbi:DUF6894 family protein [Sphingomonas sp. CFBP 8760]|uniref:DUF6894 family protein n=1 Tax=Sphingomonas sp. CFBP 8760 TaxID=2775282 RepID=UPI00177F7CE5|nr:hypothetical protein [Sphingomonas sp. CFBP 8760]MBD8547912.1 hypothetical protein [Sphingomonas sp. CFBP 8760]
MPQFYLHIFADVDACDHEAFDLPSLSAAEAAAVTGVREMVGSKIQQGLPVYRSNRIEIADQSGEVLKVVSFESVVDFRP